jgi:hypothetical protein
MLQLSIFEIVYRRLVPRLGHHKTIGAIAYRICQLIWMILNKGVRYEEWGPAVSENSRQARASRMIRTLRKLGYRVELLGGSGMSSAIHIAQLFSLISTGDEAEVWHSHSEYRPAVSNAE